MDQHPDILAELSGSQRRTARVAVRRARRKWGAGRRELLSLLAGGLVESNLQQLGGGDRDSQGFLQQRPSMGWGEFKPGKAGIREDTDDFMRALRRTNTKGMSVGSATQAVQRSAFPGRYQERLPEAKAILAGLGGGAAAGGFNAGRRGRTDVSLQSHTIPGQSFKAERGAARQDLLLGGPITLNRLLDYKRTTNALQDVPARKVSGDMVVQRRAQKDFSVPVGRRANGGTKAPGDVYEVFYDPAGRYWDSGGVRKGAIGGHSDHVHVGGNKALVEALGRRAKEMGLNVGEQDKFGGRPSSGHTEGSFHYSGEAIDVSGSPQLMAKFARIAMQEARRRARKKR